MALTICQQDRASPGGHNLENQIQQLALQVIEIADRMHDAADLQQRIKVARYLRCRRQFPQQPVWLQIDNILGMDDRGFRRTLVVFKFHTARGRDIRVFQQKQKTRIARRDLVSVSQPLLLYYRPVDEGSISAVQVSHLELPLFTPQRTVFSGNGRIYDRNLIRCLSPNRNFPFGKRNRGIFQRAREHKESGTQGLLTSCPFLSQFGAKYSSELNLFHYPNR